MSDPRGEGEVQGAATDVAGLSQVEPATAVSPLRASIPSARDGNDIWGNLPVGPRVLQLAIKELDDADGLCLYEIENEIGYLESVDIILHQVKLMQWRPISTAPTSGTHILGAKAGTSPARIWFEDGRWWMHGCGPNSRNLADLTGPYAPTHWMPLPLPPAPCDGGGASRQDAQRLDPKDDSAVDEASSVVEAPDLIDELGDAASILRSNDASYCASVVERAANLLQAPDLKALQAENDHLRASLANSGGPCAYCDLPQDRWTECASGFPGCGRYDDAMLCPNVGAWLEKQQEVDRLTTALAESERKRVEAEADAAEARAQAEILSRANADLAAGWAESSTPTQETTHVEG